MSRLRTYAPLRRQSLKVKKAQPDLRAVYRLVDQRSEGQCEVRLDEPSGIGTRCRKRGVDHHHLIKPRRAHHQYWNVIHVCREHHDRMDWPYKRGRLVLLHGFTFQIVYAAHKFEARQPKAAP